MVQGCNQSNAKEALSLFLTAPIMKGPVDEFGFGYLWVEISFVLPS